MIRGDYCVVYKENIIHTSDSPKTAIEEIERFFKPEELFEPTTFFTPSSDFNVFISFKFLYIFTSSTLTSPYIKNKIFLYKLL